MAKFTNGVNPQKVSYNIGETIIISSTFPKEYPNSGSSEDKQYIAVNMLVGYAINGGAITWNAEKRGNGRDWEDITMTDPIILPTVNADSTVTFYIVSDYNYSSNSDLIFSKLDRSKATPIHTATLQAPNTVPTINGADGDLGEKYTSFTKEYSVNDVNTSDILTVTTKLDNVQLSSFTATRNTNYTVDLSSKWNALSLGRHTIIISVNDGKATATRNYTFTKVSPPNLAPTISGNDEDLGQRADSFTQDYSVNDVNTGDTLNVTEKIDNIVIKTFTATRNTNYTLDLSSKWNALSLEQHIITISVSDGALTTNRTYTFTKSSTANHIPTISGSNGDLGEKKKAFSLDFTVNDLDVTDTLDITIKLDSTINKLIPNVERNKVYTYTIINEDFQALSNGQHTISINVSDGKANSTRTYKFTKTGQTASSEDLAIYEYASKKLDLKKDKDIYIQCKQLDDLILNFEIYNNSIPINIEQFFIEMRGGNSSNLVITSDGITKKGNKVRIECLRALTSVSGEIPIELRFSNADGKQKRTFNVILDVKPSILDSVSNTIVITALEHLDNSLEEARIINTSFNTNIANASKISNNLKDSNKTATYTKNALDLSNATATKTKDALDTSKTNADNTKKSLDTANTLAVTNKDNLEVANVQATKNYDALNALGDVTDLAKKVQTNTTNIADNTKKIEENTTQLSENIKEHSFIDELKLQFIYGVKGDGITDDSEGILRALSENKTIVFQSNKIYRMTKQLVLDGHILKGSFGGGTFNTPTKIIFDSLDAVDSCVLIKKASQADNILFEHSFWDSNTKEVNGLIVQDKFIANNCGFNAFPGYGALLYRSQLRPDLAPYMSCFKDCNFDYNKKHNIVIGNGCNAVIIINPQARWAGTTIYKTNPTVVGEYDGIYIDGKMDNLTAGLDFEPSGNIIIGGNISYNSRYGINYRYGNDNTQIGGYLEGNLSGKDIAIDNSYGTTIMNPMAYTKAPLITTKNTDSNNSSRSLNNYPNNIVVRGDYYGTGAKNKNNMYQEKFISNYLENGPIFTKDGYSKHFIFDKAYGGTGENQSFVKYTDLIHLNSKNSVFGTETPNTDKGTWFFPLNENEGARNAVFLNGLDATKSKWTVFYSAQGNGGSITASALQIPTNSITGRSINAGGTVNVSGADYAEYMYKSNINDIIEKGEICGIDCNGKLTKCFNKSHTFVVKSTNPSYVGGDIWSSDLEQLYEPTQANETDEEFEIIMTQYKIDKAKLEMNIEIERQKVDRIAFSGQVPVNVLNTNVGDYIIPFAEGENIIGKSITNPTFEEYKKAVGKVVSIEDDGRARIIVKVS